MAKTTVLSRRKSQDKDEADVVWELDMMKELKVSQHNMCSCSVTCVGDLLFVNTSNGVDEGHFTIPEEEAPSFICVNRNSGEVLVDRQIAGRQHSARPVVVAGLRSI